MMSGTRDGNASIGGGGLRGGLGPEDLGREDLGLRSCNGTSRTRPECDYLRGVPAKVIVSMRPRVHSSKFGPLGHDWDPTKVRRARAKSPLFLRLRGG